MQAYVDCTSLADLRGDLNREIDLNSLRRVMSEYTGDAQDILDWVGDHQWLLACGHAYGVHVNTAVRSAIRHSVSGAVPGVVPESDEVVGFWGCLGDPTGAEGAGAMGATPAVNPVACVTAEGPSQGPAGDGRGT